MPPSEGNVVQKALRGYILKNKDIQRDLKFCEYEWKGEKYSCDSYEQYWHAFYSGLKPLLFFPYIILCFYSILQTIIMYTSMVVLQKKI